MNSPDADFINNIWDQFNLTNYVDYFIFLNLLRATDNTGKNIYLAKYNSDEPYYYVPWDLDGCFGTIWDGTNEHITDDILTNNFFDRVIELNPENYSKTVANRWFEYRDDFLETSHLIEKFEDQYNFLSDHKVYEREAIVYPNYSFGQEDLSYLTVWLQERLSFLDSYFDNLLPINEVSGKASKVLLHPNPTDGQLYLRNCDDCLGEEYKIYDVLGNLMTVETLRRNYISIEKLNRGIYILIIQNQAHQFVVK